MPIALDHIIINVNDLEASAAFYTSILGLADEGREGPFAMLRVTPDLTLQLAPFGTDGHQHYAFAFPKAEFDAAFDRVKAAGIEYGDSFHTVGNMAEPGRELGAHGMGASIYFWDPDRHLLEIRHYDDAG